MLHIHSAQFEQRNCDMQEMMLRNLDLRHARLPLAASPLTRNTGSRFCVCHVLAELIPSLSLRKHSGICKCGVNGVSCLFAERLEEARPEPGGVRGTTRSSRIAQAGGQDAGKPPPSSPLNLELHVNDLKCLTSSHKRHTAISPSSSSSCNL